MNTKPTLIRPPVGTKIVVTGSTGFASSSTRLYTVHEHRGSTIVVLVDSKGRQSDWKATFPWGLPEAVLLPHPRGSGNPRQGEVASPGMIARAEASERLMEACSEVERIGRENGRLAAAATGKTVQERNAALREAILDLLPCLTTVRSKEVR